MQYEPPAINFPVRKETPQELREGEAAWPWAPARARSSLGRGTVPWGQTRIKQGNRRQGRAQKPRY